MRLSSDIWVYALIRRVELAGSFATVARKGDARAGAVVVKTLDRRSGAARLWSETIGPDGETLWMQPADYPSEDDADAWLGRAARVDPDLWVVEIEDANGARVLTEAVDDR